MRVIPVSSIAFVFPITNFRYRRGKKIHWLLFVEGIIHLTYSSLANSHRVLWMHKFQRLDNLGDEVCMWFFSLLSLKLPQDEERREKKKQAFITTDALLLKTRRMKEKVSIDLCSLEMLSGSDSSSKTTLHIPQARSNVFSSKSTGLRILHYSSRLHACLVAFSCYFLASFFPFSL